MKPLRVLVADDEAPARRWLRALLAHEPAVELVGECADGDETVHALRTLRPDVVLLDVRMPGLDGFEVLSELAHPPAVVFVSAYDVHAVRAFEVAAVDYLLKPFDGPRLALALQRARRACTAAGGGADELLVAAAGGRVAFLRLDEIDWIEAAGNYLQVHVAGRVHLARGTLEAVHARTAERGFVRIHRSRLVRASAIRALRPLGTGDLELELVDGTHLRASRRQRAALAAALPAVRPAPAAARPGDGAAPAVGE